MDSKSVLDPLGEKENSLIRPFLHASVSFFSPSLSTRLLTSPSTFYYLLLSSTSPCLTSPSSPHSPLTHTHYPRQSASHSLSPSFSVDDILTPAIHLTILYLYPFSRLYLSPCSHSLLPSTLFYPLSLTPPSPPYPPPQIKHNKKKSVSAP